MLLTQFLHLDALNWMLRQVTVYLSIAFIIIFQPEIRRALAEVGKQPALSGTRTDRSVVDKLAKAAAMLSERKIGALIAIEGEIGTRLIQETGTPINSRLSPELLATIFFPHTPLHDGGVIIHNDTILAAGCIFPLTPREELSRALGTRHRAAIGLTEETDALALVVSEETGTVSLAYRGRLTRGLDDERLRRILQRLLLRGKAGSCRSGRGGDPVQLNLDELFGERETLRREEGETHA